MSDEQKTRRRWLVNSLIFTTLAVIILAGYLSITMKSKLDHLQQQVDAYEREEMASNTMIDSLLGKTEELEAANEQLIAICIPKGAVK